MFSCHWKKFHKLPRLADTWAWSWAFPSWTWTGSFTFWSENWGVESLFQNKVSSKVSLLALDWTKTSPLVSTNVWMTFPTGAWMAATCTLPWSSSTTAGGISTCSLAMAEVTLCTSPTSKHTLKTLSRLFWLSKPSKLSLNYYKKASMISLGNVFWSPLQVLWPLSVSRNIVSPLFKALCRLGLHLSANDL